MLPHLETSTRKETMSLNPIDFLQKVDNKGGLARANKFSVQITPPTALHAAGADVISFLCKAAEFPGKGWSTVEDRIYGIEVLKPYAAVYEPITLTFYNTNDFAVKKFWEIWLDYIQPQGTRNMQYYDKMVGEIRLYHYNETAESAVVGKENYFCGLNEAWPLSLQETEINWDNDELYEFQVQIQYKDWISSAGKSAGQHAADDYTSNRIADFQKDGTTNRGF